MTDKPHVAWILEASSLSGGVRVIYELANGLSERGFPVSILSLSPKPTWFSIHGKVRWLTFGGYPALAVAAKENLPDVVIATWWKTAYVAQSICENTSCRGMYLVQDIETEYYHDPITRKAVMDTYALGLEHFTTSRWVMANCPNGCKYVGIAIGKMRQKNKEGERRKRQALAVMRRQALKGFRELGEVALRLQKSNIPVVTFGTDTTVRLSGLHEHIGNPGSRDVIRLYSTSSVFLSTSLHEGFSMTPVEAMTCGLPVVQFPADGNMEYAVDGENCLLAQSPKHMAELAVRVLSDRALASSLSKSGLETARRYSDWAGPIDRLAALVERT